MNMNFLVNGFKERVESLEKKGDSFAKLWNYPQNQSDNLLKTENKYLQKINNFITGKTVAEPPTNIFDSNYFQKILQNSNVFNSSNLQNSSVFNSSNLQNSSVFNSSNLQNSSVFNSSDLQNSNVFNSSNLQKQIFQTNENKMLSNLEIDNQKIEKSVASDLQGLSQVTNHSNVTNSGGFNIDMSGMKNTINRQSDVENIIMEISKKLEEALMSSVEGVI